jgi:hypothetical protein
MGTVVPKHQQRCRRLANGVPAGPELSLAFAD